MVRVENATLSKRDIYKRSSMVVIAGDTIHPGERATLVNTTGRGRLLGFALEWHNVDHGNMKLYITIDGEEFFIGGSYFALVFGFLDSPPAVGTMHAKPWTLINWDTTDDWYSVSLTVPLSFYSSIKIEIENADTTNDLIYGFATVVEKEVGT